MVEVLLPWIFGTSPFHLSIFCFSISSGVSDSAIFLLASASASALILIASALPSASILACSAWIVAFSFSCSAAISATSLSLSACTLAVLASILANSSSCCAFTFFWIAACVSSSVEIEVKFTVSIMIPYGSNFLLRYSSSASFSSWRLSPKTSVTGYFAVTSCVHAFIFGLIKVFFTDSPDWPLNWVNTSVTLLWSNLYENSKSTKRDLPSAVGVLKLSSFGESPLSSDVR